MYNLCSLEGKRILVTGAASGMGRATAITCSKLGAEITCIDRNGDGILETLSLMDMSMHKSCILDLADTESWSSFLESSPVYDGIANCAGIASMKPFTFIDKTDIDKVFGVNFIGPVLLVKSLLKYKKLSKPSSVVFVSSVDGPKIVHQGNSVYSSSKAALVGMARNMAVDLAPKGIRVNCVLPGTTDTPLIRTSNVTEEQLSSISNSFPLKRLGTPQDMANAIVFLLSDASSFITGTELVVDGGYSLL